MESWMQQYLLNYSHILAYATSVKKNKTQLLPITSGGFRNYQGGRNQGNMGEAPEADDILAKGKLANVLIGFKQRMYAISKVSKCTSSGTSGFVSILIAEQRAVQD